jgi:hypothetical protein
VPAKPTLRQAINIPAHYAQKTVAFHFEFGSEIIENARYEMQILNSWKNLRLANKALGRYTE